MQGLTNVSNVSLLLRNKFYVTFVKPITNYEQAHYERWNFNSGNYLFTTDTK